VKRAGLLLAALALAACPKSEKGGAGKWMAAAKAGTPIYATFETSMGSVVIKLYSKEAPVTVENFVGLASGEKPWTDPRTRAQQTGKPLYDGTVFHRVIEGFMVQGGDPLGNGTGGPGYDFGDEFQSGKTFDRVGLLAMANAGPNTNGSQFFITTSTPTYLNNKHTIFGEVVKGYDVVEAISKAPKAPGDRPDPAITLKHVTLSDSQP